MERTENNPCNGEHLVRVKEHEHSKMKLPKQQRLQWKKVTSFTWRSIIAPNEINFIIQIAFPLAKKQESFRSICCFLVIRLRPTHTYTVTYFILNSKKI